jgi:hypothetical protein
MRINHLASVLLILAASVLGHAQGPDTDPLGPDSPDIDVEKLDKLATAIAHAEGFGKRGTIPSRYHNPGDLKASSASLRLAGQVRIGKAGHIVFKDDEAGKTALKNCILMMMDGRSAHFQADMTLSQMARVYAENWRPWVRIVAGELAVPTTMTLREYFALGVVPAVTDVPVPGKFRTLPVAAAKLAPVTSPTVTFPRQDELADVLRIPVLVPPLVEPDAAEQHHRFAILHRTAKR